MKKKMVLVIAGRVSQYRDWVRERPGVPSRCITEERDCDGYDPNTCRLAFTGTWFQLPTRVLDLVRYRFGESERYFDTVQHGGRSGTIRNRPMFTIKDDGEPITWDDEGMASAGPILPPLAAQSSALSTSPGEEPPR